MSDRAAAELIHKTNNLLAVIYTQVAVGRQALEQGQTASVEAALTQIMDCAESTQVFVKSAAEALRRSES